MDPRYSNGRTPDAHRIYISHPYYSVHEITDSQTYL